MSTASKITMRDLAAERDVLDLFLAETEGEETQEIGELLAWLQDVTEEKVERWGVWLLRQQQDVETIKAEEQRLAARRKALENAIARSKERLQMELETRGIDKVKRPLCTVRIQNNSPALKGELAQEVLQELYAAEDPIRNAVKFIPGRFDLDRRAVLALTKAGETLLPEGLEIVQARSLRLA